MARWREALGVAAAATVIEDAARGVCLEVLVEGTGEDVVLVPSAMRGAVDFAHLQAALAEAGYRSLALNPRGVGRSSRARDGVSLRDLADDVAFVVSEFGSGRAHLVGHALGNIVVRATASYRPDVVATVTVMPCGGHNLGAYPLSSEVLAAFSRCHDEMLSDDDRLEALRIAFFAAGNDPRSWLHGWWSASTFGAVTTQVDPEEWWRAGSVPILIIQPLEDAMVPTEAGRESAVAFGDRATYVEVPRCGHAILPEQPDAIADHVIEFLRGHSHAPAAQQTLR
jgi:pimeloyl-ACP methyl ester carboxylesterase